MPRLISGQCRECKREYRDVFVMRRPDIVICECGGEVDEDFAMRTSLRPWDMSEAAVVFKAPDGSYRFPCRNDAPTPVGCERVVIRSDREMAAVEAASGTRNEARWFDRGSGKDFDSEPPSPHRPSERERFERFKKAYY